MALYQGMQGDGSWRRAKVFEFEVVDPTEVSSETSPLIWVFLAALVAGGAYFFTM